LQEIKNEPYPADQLGPAPTVNYAPPPPQPSASQSPPPTSGATASAGPAAGTAGPNLCPNCSNPLRPNALYCRSCGAKLR
jgi:hypothetical protein